MAGIAELLPASDGRPGRPALGPRLQDRARPDRREDRLRPDVLRHGSDARPACSFGAAHEGKVTAIAVFEQGPAVQRPSVSAGRDREALGPRRGPDRRPHRRDRRRRQCAHQFPPPTLESVVAAASNPDDRARLRVALDAARRAGPADQRPAGRRTRTSSRSRSTARSRRRSSRRRSQTDYGLDVDVPRDDADLRRAAASAPARRSRSSTRRRTRSSPRSACASIPAPASSGIEFRLRRRRRRRRRCTSTRRSTASRSTWRSTSATTLREGLHGWQVTDCVVTMTDCAYSVPDGPPSRRGPLSTAADFRKLTPLVLMQALEQRADGGLRAGRPRARSRFPRSRSAPSSRPSAASARRPRRSRCEATSPRSRRSCPSSRAQDLQRRAVEADERRGRARVVVRSATSR